MKVLRFLVLLTALSLIIFSTDSYAETIYATGNDGTSLITIDTGTGVGTVVGDTGTVDTFATAFGPDGTLYTVTDVRSDGSNSYLGTFDLSSGAVTTIGGPLDLGYMTSLEFAPDGTLYAGRFGGPGNFGLYTDLYTIDTATGTTSYVGDLGFDFVMDFAFDSSGTLWAVGEHPDTYNNSLYTIDTATGAGTLVTEITGTNGFVMGIMFDSNDTLYATDMVGLEYGVGSTLYTINMSDGSATSVGLTGIDYAHGGDIGIVPEPISSTLFIIGGATLGFRRFRKKFVN